MILLEMYRLLQRKLGLPDFVFPILEIFGENVGSIDSKKNLELGRKFKLWPDSTALVLGNHGAILLANQGGELLLREVTSFAQETDSVGVILLKHGEVRYIPLLLVLILDSPYQTCRIGTGVKT
jgi:hypothetical protein